MKFLCPFLWLYHLFYFEPCKLHICFEVVNLTSNIIMRNSKQSFKEMLTSVVQSLEKDPKFYENVTIYWLLAHCTNSKTKPNFHFNTML